MIKNTPNLFLLEHYYWKQKKSQKQINEVSNEEVLKTQKNKKNHKFYTTLLSTTFSVLLETLFLQSLHLQYFPQVWPFM